LSSSDFFTWLFEAAQGDQLPDPMAPVKDAARPSAPADDGRRDMERRYERLRLVTMAMWALLKERSGLTEADLQQYVNQVDLIDGKLDGRLAREKGIIECPKCRRRVLKTALACVYCGEPNGQGDSFLGT
jgi:hypothetical protein